MIMTGRYKVTGQNFYSSDFNSFAFVPQNGQTEKSPKYKGKINSAGTDFDNFVRNRFPHYYGGGGGIQTIVIAMTNRTFF